MTKFYKVTFDTHENRVEKHWRIDVEAHNAHEAEELARRQWTRKPFMFFFKCRLIKPGEEFLYHWFTRLNANTGI